jgi:hypothetical protein
VCFLARGSWPCASWRGGPALCFLARRSGPALPGAGVLALRLLARRAHLREWRRAPLAALPRADAVLAVLSPSKAAILESLAGELTDGGTFVE